MYQAGLGLRGQTDPDKGVMRSGRGKPKWNFELSVEKINIKLTNMKREK